MALFEYQLDDHVALVTMNNGENRFTYDSLKAFEDLLGEIEEQIRACEQQLLTELGCVANRPVEDFVPAVRRNS